MSTMVVVVLFTFLFVGLFQPAQTFFTCQISRRICSDITPSQDFSLRMTHNDGDKGFGVGEKAIEFRDLMRSEKNIDVSVPEKNRDSLKRKQKEGVVGDSPTLRPKAILRFVAPTLALWIAPPIMSLVDTSVVGRFCGPTDLAGKIFFVH